MDFITIHYNKVDLVLELRRIRKNELRLIFDLEKRSIHFNNDIKNETYVYPTREEHNQSFDKSCYLAIFHQDKVIAYSSVRFLSSGSTLHGIKVTSKTAYFVNTLVDPNFRGYQLHQTLLQSKEKEAILQKCQFIYVTVSPINKTSLQNLMKFGFTIQQEMFLYGNKKRYLLGKEC